LSGNVIYRTDQLVKYFSLNRIRWADFYKSEQVIIGELKLDSRVTVLDIGCGCGGLGLALREQFRVGSYTGVEINQQAVDAGRSMNPEAELLCGDILALDRQELYGKRFDVVFSLSCIDWNNQFDDMLQVAWKFVQPGGVLVITLRLVDGEGCNDIQRSYQYINFEGVREGELAAYVVLNAGDLMERVSLFDPAAISAYGYWGVPSSTAVTSFTRLCFAALAIHKRNGQLDPTRFDLRLPFEIRTAMGTPRATVAANGRKPFGSP
jgi:SAM-dependent methyltransferase